MAGRSPEWVPCPEPLDRGLLLARDPILLYDEVPLYESELDDNGASQLHAKARAAPCWRRLAGTMRPACHAVLPWAQEYALPR